MISKNFFQSRKSQKICECSFLGLVETSRLHLKNFKNSKNFLFTQSFFQKSLFGRRFCSSLATGMFDTSNCCKLSPVGQLQFSPEVDFRFFFQDRRSIKYLVFTTQIDKNIFQALFLTENFTK